MNFTLTNMTRLRATEIPVLNQFSRTVVVSRTTTAGMCVLRFAAFRDVGWDEGVGSCLCGVLASFEVGGKFFVFALDDFVVAGAAAAIGGHDWIVGWSVFVGC
jgi:hypothetical protein